MAAIPTISRDELRGKFENGEPFVLVDALPPMSYAHSHLPGAVNLPPERVDESAAKRIADKDAEIVVYCADGPCPNSGIASARLTELGYADVSDYNEGKAEWIAAGLPVEGRSRAAAAA